MKQLFVIRHGEYSHDGLNDLGRAQIGALASKLKEVTNGGTVLILTSTTARARESAEILGSSFCVGFEEHEILCSDDSHRCDLFGTLELVRSRKDGVDVLVLVTHYEYVEDFPGYFAQKELGVVLCSHSIQKGEAWVLDCDQKTLTHVSPY